MIRVDPRDTPEQNCRLKHKSPRIASITRIRERYARHKKIRVDPRDTPEPKLQTETISPRIASITRILE